MPANSGQVTTRYRLNRYRDRQLNRALHTVVRVRIQYQPATRDYLARRSAEGKTSREVKRCLARYVVRDGVRSRAGWLRGVVALTPLARNDESRLLRHDGWERSV